MDSIKEVFANQGFVIVLATIFVFSFVVQLYYYWAKFRGFAFGDAEAKVQAEFVPISVVVCARNEAENLEKHLPKLMELDYPGLEVVVVNDCSYDSSKEILENFEKLYPQLKVTSLSEDMLYHHDKKFAVTIGIKAAKNEHILFTDADCIPKSIYWVKEMASGFTAGKEIVLGYGAYDKEPGFINKLIRFDTFFIAFQYFSSTLLGRPYMGVGRNLAYTKSLFFRNKGFASHAHIRSGDDDLFINKVATHYNTSIRVLKDAHTTSIPKPNFSEWFDQKRRHITTGRHYKAGDKSYLFTQQFTLTLFYFSMIALLILQFQPIIVLSLFLVRYMSQLVLLNKAMTKLDEKDLLPFAFILEFFLVFIYPLLAIANTFNHEPRWK